METSIMDVIHQTFQQNAELMAAVSGLAGLLLGNWMAIGRDKRQEFNALVGPIRAELIVGLELPQPFVRLPKPAEIDQISTHLYPWTRARLNAVIKQCQETMHREHTQDSFGGHAYKDPEKVRDAARKLLPILRRK